MPGLEWLDQHMNTTHDQNAFDATRGWVALEQFQARAEQHWLMSRDL